MKNKHNSHIEHDFLQNNYYMKLFLLINQNLLNKYNYYENNSFMHYDNNIKHNMHI